MSDSQTPLLSTEQRLELLAYQRQAQQRQILAMMGIGQWVRLDTPTLKISDIGDSETPQLVSTFDTLSEQQPAFTQPTQQQDSLESSQAEDVFTSAPVVENNTDNNIASAETANKFYNFNDLNSFVELERVEEAVNASDATSLESSHLDPISFEKVAPFDLQGGRYGDWVLIVDIQALNNDTQKLWQNITQALSLQCETSSFPICEGMDTAELANASLAGYIFRIAQSEDIKIAVLTSLPEGLMHPNFVESPSLEAMLADSALKRQLWQQLSS